MSSTTLSVNIMDAFSVSLGSGEYYHWIGRGWLILREQMRLPDLFQSFKYLSYPAVIINPFSTITTLFMLSL